MSDHDKNARALREIEQEIERQFDGCLLDAGAISDEEIARELREVGFDPEAIARRAVALRHTVEQEGTGSWRARARRSIARHKSVERRAPARAACLDRGQLIARIEALRGRDARPVAASLRGFDEGDLSEEELRGLIEDLELLYELDEGERVSPNRSCDLGRERAMIGA